MIDGTGAAARAADVLVRDGRIEDILAPGTGPTTATVLDATGMVVSPGFIDIHTHSDVILVRDPRGQSKVRQGVTTEVTGNCSFSAFPIDPARGALHADHLARIGDGPLLPDWVDLDGYAAALDATGMALNVAPLLGHGTLRVAVMGVADRPPDAEELGRMRRLAAVAMDQGAFGMSTGLTHVPSAYAAADEIEAIVDVVARAGRLYATHARAVSGNWTGALEEAVDVGRQTGVRLQFSHIAINEPQRWGQADVLLKVIEHASDAGIDIAFDVYPYDASCSSLTQYLPGWLQEGGSAAMQARLSDTATRARAVADMEHGFWGGMPWMWDRIVVSRSGPGAEDMPGSSIAELADRLGQDPRDVVLDLCARYGNAPEVILFYRTEADMLTFLGHELAVLGSDGNALPFDQGAAQPHPRHFGTFPRVLGRYVRDVPRLRLEEAVARMTGRPAARLGMTDRGVLRIGAVADITIFDAGSVADRATFLDPCQPPIGIRDVLVAGIASVRDGVQTDARPGRVLRASSHG